MHWSPQKANSLFYFGATAAIGWFNVLTLGPSELVSRFSTNNELARTLSLAPVPTTIGMYWAAVSLVESIALAILAYRTKSRLKKDFWIVVSYWLYLALLLGSLYLLPTILTLTNIHKEFGFTLVLPELVFFLLQAILCTLMTLETGKSVKQ